MEKMFDGNAKISVITVVYNCIAYLEESIQSVLSQSYPSIEYIIIDGGSTDGSVDIIRNYEANIDYWISEPDRGIYHAMNKGIAKATGDYLLFLGADDRLLPDFTAMARELSIPTAVYYANMMFKGKICYGEFSDYKVCKYQIPHQATFYPKSVFDTYQYNETYRIAADYYLTMCCKADRRFLFEYKDYVVAYFREGGISSERDPLFERDRGKIIRRLFGLRLYLRYKFHAFKGRYKQDRSSKALNR